MTDRVFGYIEGVPLGSIFSSRRELARAGIHKPLQAGISGSATEGADSIVLSGGYEDDEDYGEVIVYTGHGGRDPNSGRQNSDQTLTLQNRALVLSQTLGLPMRVVRGHSHDSPWSPDVGYKYDGLYFVEDSWRERGISGYFVWRYRLVRSMDVPIGRSDKDEPQEEVTPPARRNYTTSRIIRDSNQSRLVKRIHDFSCQVCGLQLETISGLYAEGAHIVPLGAPHNGPDTQDNIICLCPNHHVLFDYGAFAIADDFTLIGLSGRLHLNSAHEINLDYIRYRREQYFNLILK